MGAITGTTVALVVGAVLGWIGAGWDEETANPDLRAMCVTLGELDVAVLDQTRAGDGVDSGDPNLARLGALPSLATAAASHPDVPEALAESGGRLSFAVSQGDVAGVRDQVDELRDHCSQGSDGSVAPTTSPTPAPAPSSPQVQVTEGTYQGSQRPWTLHARWTTDEQLCLQLSGRAPRCSPRPEADQPGALTGWNGSSSFDGDQWSGCATGGVDPAAATVELVFSGGRTHQATPVDADLQPPATVFVHCWSGHRRLIGARSLSADGQVLDRINPDMLDRTDDQPIDPTTPWRQLGAGTADTDLLRTHDAQQCQASPDATLIEADWPLEDRPDGQDVRQYVRDPDGQLTDRHAADFDADTSLPAGAEYTGYHTEAADLFLDPTTANTRIYIVTRDRVEQWPRLTPPLDCS